MLWSQGCNLLADEYVARTVTKSSGHAQFIGQFIRVLATKMCACVVTHGFNNTKHHHQYVFMKAIVRCIVLPVMTMVGAFIL